MKLSFPFWVAGVHAPPRLARDLLEHELSAAKDALVSHIGVYGAGASAFMFGGEVAPELLSVLVPRTLLESYTAALQALSEWDRNHAT